MIRIEKKNLIQSPEWKLSGRRVRVDLQNSAYLSESFQLSPSIDLRFSPKRSSVIVKFLQFMCFQTDSQKRGCQRMEYCLEAQARLLKFQFTLKPSCCFFFLTSKCNQTVEILKVLSNLIQLFSSTIFSSLLFLEQLRMCAEVNGNGRCLRAQLCVTT